MNSIIFGLLLVGMIVPIYAQSFESIDDENYLFLSIDKNTASGIFRINDNIISFQNEIKFDDNGVFKIRLAQDRILLHGTLEQVKIIDLNEKKNYDIKIQKLSDVGFEVPEQEHIGMPHIETLLKEEEQKQKEIEDAKRLEELANKKPPSEYVKSDTEKIVILGNTPQKFPYYKAMSFDVRVVDTERNPFVKFQTFWDDNMGIDGVIINATVIDPDGIIISEMSGVTEDKGKYTSPDTHFSQNYKRGLYSIIVNATQYLDDAQTYAVDSLISKFSLYTPSKDSSPKCESGYELWNSICLTKCESGYEREESGRCVLK